MSSMLKPVRNHVGPRYRRDIDRPRKDRSVVSNSVEDKKPSEEQKWILVRKKGKVSNMKKVRFMEKDKTQDGDNNDWVVYVEHTRNEMTD